MTTNHIAFGLGADSLKLARQQPIKQEVSLVHQPNQDQTLTLTG